MSDSLSPSAVEHTPMLPSAALARGLKLPSATHQDDVSGARNTLKQEWNALQCGPFTLLFSRRLPCQILPITPLCQVPHSAPFLLGAFSVQGFVTPVFDLDLACGFHAIESRYWLVFGHDDERLSLATTALPTRQSTEGLQLLQSPPALPPLLQAAANQTFHFSNHYGIEVNADRLFGQLAASAFGWRSPLNH